MFITADEHLLVLSCSIFIPFCTCGFSSAFRSCLLSPPPQMGYIYVHLKVYFNLNVLMHLVVNFTPDYYFSIFVC